MHCLQECQREEFAPVLLDSIIILTRPFKNVEKEYSVASFRQFTTGILIQAKSPNKAILGMLWVFAYTTHMDENKQAKELTSI